MFRKVLVANRGEIAVRVMRACKELDIQTVAVYSDADSEAGHVRYADEAYRIGPARAADSYLDQEAIVEAAISADADAIHPGYGFLAENAAFAERVEASPVTWIGPPSGAMAQLGEKTGARRVMRSADVPVVPGTTEPIEDPETVAELGEEYGYPIAIKAEGGGGGRGMKVVHGPDDIESQLEAAKREGEAYFDNPSVYVEKYLPNPRHIEVQVIADQHGNVRHLGERDCSLQRRHQKVIEEGPSPALSAEQREEVGEAARRGVAEAEYTNAGTVEFLLQDGQFYFLEVNTRIQVEHTVTEALTGIDIVKWQLRVAMGEELGFDQDAVDWRGHAIEYRINAENPSEEFSPTPGTLSVYDPPGGIGVRLDDAVRQGDEISGDYDSMIAKLIVAGSDREECLARSERALKEYDIEGVHTTIPFHRLMLTDETFLEGEHTTSYLDETLDPSRIDEAVYRWGPTDISEAEDEDTRERSFTVEVNNKRFAVSLTEHDTEPIETTTSSKASGPPTPRSSASEEDGGTSVEGEEITAEMQGTILEVGVEAGDTIEAGDVVCVLEAMKMENDIEATRGGTVADVLVEEGQSVDLGDVLIVLE